MTTLMMQSMTSSKLDLGMMFLSLTEVKKVESEFRREDVKFPIINMDETHHDLSIHYRWQSRHSSLDVSQPQPATGPSVKLSPLVMWRVFNYATGEASAPMSIFDLGAENFRVKVEWVEGVPSIKKWFGYPRFIVLHAFYTVHAKGSMDNSLLNDYCERVF